MKIKTWYMLFICCLLLVGTGSAAAVEGDEKSYRLEYYQYNSCASCSPQEEFYQIMIEELGELGKEYPYVVHEYNPFHLEDQNRMKEQAQKLGVSLASVNEPALIIGNRMLVGLDEIRMEVQTVYREYVTGNQQMETADENISIEETASDESENDAESWRIKAEQIANETELSDSVLLYFSTLSCDDCARVKELLGKLDETAEMPDGAVSAVKIYEFNIMEADNVELLQQMFVSREVPKTQQQVPILFYQGGYLSGADEAEAKLESEIAKGKLQNFMWEETEAGMKDFSAGTYLSLLATGLVNGLNPCGASMLMMLLAAVVMAGKSVWKLGISYLAGKFAAYLAMGLGLYHLFFMMNQEILLTVSRGITRVFAVLFVVLAGMYLLDFVHARKQEYQKVRMQLPGFLRKWNHGMIERMSKVSGKWLFPAVCLLGVIISAGEFFCTGQVYLAAILYLMKMPQADTLQTVSAFLIYVTAMCVPSLLLVLLIEKTGNVIRASNTALKWMPFIKLATAVVFIAIAVFMLFL